MSLAFQLSANAFVIACVGIASQARDPKNIAVYAAFTFTAIGLVSLAVFFYQRSQKRNRRIITKWK